MIQLWSFSFDSVVQIEETWEILYGPKEQLLFAGIVQRPYTLMVNVSNILKTPRIGENIWSKSCLICVDFILLRENFQYLYAFMKQLLFLNFCEYSIKHVFFRSKMVNERIHWETGIPNNIRVCNNGECIIHFNFYNFNWNHTDAHEHRIHHRICSCTVIPYFTLAHLSM